MTIVEIGQALARHEKPSWYDDEPVEREEDGTVRTHQVASPTVVECGIRYQRCGGGRRVLRKTGGD